MIGRRMLGMLMIAMVAAAPRTSLASQLEEAGLVRLRVSVVIVDHLAPRPIPFADFRIRPSSGAPGQEIIERTDEAGAFAISLRPGGYSLESARPVAFKGSRHTWKAAIDLKAGRAQEVGLTDGEALGVRGDAGGPKTEMVSTRYALDRRLHRKSWPMFRGGVRHTGRGIGSGASGATEWVFQQGGHHVTSSPAIGSDGTVYVGSDDHFLYALDGATGAEKWSFQTRGAVESSPAIGSDGTVYVGSSDGNVYAIK